MKLNLGCNDLKLASFVNVDIDPSVKPDMTADCLNLPFEDESIDEIYAGHLLEHTTAQEGALKEWHRVLKKGGKLTVTVPDIEKSLELYRTGKIDVSLLNQVVFGADDRHEQNHHQIFTRDILKTQMGGLFTVTILEKSPLTAFDVEWQTIAQGIK